METELTVPVDTCSMAGPNGSRIPTEEPHAWVSRKGPDNIWVRTCHRCPAIDWDDLREGVLAYAATLTPASAVAASMGGPLSEAEGAAARIRAYLDACTDANSFGREIRWELRDADGHPYNLPRADIVAVLDALGVLEGQLATAREELGELLPIASPYRTTKADRDRNWLHGAWESFAARAKTARAAANRWAREADRLEEWAAKRKSEKDAGTWPPCQGCDEHPARALGLDGGGSGE